MNESIIYFYMLEEMSEEGLLIFIKKLLETNTIWVVYEVPDWARAIVQKERKYKDFREGMIPKFNSDTLYITGNNYYDDDFFLHDYLNLFRKGFFEKYKLLFK